MLHTLALPDRHILILRILQLKAGSAVEALLSAAVGKLAVLALVPERAVTGVATGGVLAFRTILTGEVVTLVDINITPLF